MTPPKTTTPVLLITRNKYGMGAEFFPSEAAALADVLRELKDHHDAPDDLEADITAIADWIGDEDISYEFDLQPVTLPSHRIVVVEADGALVTDQLIYGDRAAADFTFGGLWNAYGFGHKGRAVYLYRTGEAEPIRRLSHDDVADALVTDPLTRPA